jgi:hypothetical protein
MSRKAYKVLDEDSFADEFGHDNWRDYEDPLNFHFCPVPC